MKTQEKVKYYVEVIGLDEQTAKKLVVEEIQKEKEGEENKPETPNQFKTSNVARFIAEQNKPKP